MLRLDDLSTDERELVQGVYECDKHPPYAIEVKSPSCKLATELSKRGWLIVHEIGMGLIIAFTTNEADSILDKST